MLKLKDVVLVILQFIGLISFFLNITWFKIEVLEHFIWFYTGLVGVVLIVIALLQLNINFSPFPPPKSDSKLITNGAFKYIRHPIYSGILLFMFSFSLWLGDGFKLCISIVTLFLFYYKSSYEESLLETAFETYGGYKKRAGRFLPKFYRSL
jgi:protein-S-isoprenylcysteine O-methyltransferase Ste14